MYSNKSGANVKVVCRFRPLNDFEKQSGDVIDFAITKNSQVKIKTNKKNEQDYNFNFDYAFNIDTEQKEVFEVVARPVIDGVFEGWNGTILAYGQTSSGKTFTMQGMLTRRNDE